MFLHRYKAECRGAPVISGLIVSALFGSWTTPAYAQTEDPQTQTGTVAEPAEATDDEIVVTAQRREQYLQEVPISIVAIGREELDNRNVTESSRLEQVAPGLSIGRSGADPRPAIRGIYTESIQGNNDPRVGFYIDEIYQSRTSQLSVPFVDLQRVEVQKGPQGTLFGRNSFGGNIALVTMPPGNEFQSGVDMLVGSYNRIMVTGYGNIPITDGLAVRLAGATERRDGIIKSLANPFADMDDKGHQYIRGALRWKPPALGDRLEVMLRASYWNEDDAGNGAFNAKAIGQFIDPALVTPPGGTLNVGNATFTFPLGFNGRSFTGQFVPYSTFRDGIPDINGADIGILIPGPYKSLNDARSFTRIKSKQFSAAVTYDLTNTVRLRSITGLVDFKANRGGDNDGTRAPFGIGYFITRDKSFSQELQVLSNDSSSPLSYVFGGYYLNDRIPDAFLGVRNRTYSTLGAIASGQLPLYFGSNFTTLPNVPAALIRAPASDSYNPLSNMAAKSYAGYGQVSYTFADRLTLTGGLRYTIDKKAFRSALNNRFAPAGTYLVFRPTTDFNQTCNGFTPADPSSTAPAAVVAEALITRCGKKTFKYFTYRAAADYKFSDDLMVYASYSTGKHSGGFSYSVIPGQSDLQLPFFDTEGVKAYEVGMKGSFLDNRVRVNLAAFYNLYDQLQVQTSFASPNVPNSVITVASNGAKAKAPGVDLEVFAEPTRRLRLNLAANYLRARDDPFPVSVTDNGICAIVAPGGTCTTRPEVRLGFGGGILPNPVSNPELFVPVLGPDGRQIVVGGVPQFNALGYNKKTRVQNTPDITLRGGIAYDIDLGTAGTLTPEVQTYFNGGYLLSKALVNFKQKSYTKTELRLTYRNAKDNLSLQAFVENLEDEAVIGRVTIASGGGFSGTFAAPRTYGLRLGYRY